MSKCTRNLLIGGSFSPVPPTSGPFSQSSEGVSAEPRGYVLFLKYESNIKEYAEYMVYSRDAPGYDTEYT